MKKNIILFVMLSFMFKISLSQTSSSFQLSEDSSRQIVQSQEFQTLFSLQNEFLDKIKNAINNGYSLDSIKKATINAVENSDNNQIYSILFNDYNSGVTFFNSVAASKRAIKEKYPFIEENRSTFVCNTCQGTITDEVNYFYKNFQTFDTYRFYPGIAPTGREALPTCGSWGNQVRLGVCATLCGAATAGIGLAACGWGCWCTFCTSNSSVSSVICSN